MFMNDIVDFFNKAFDLFAWGVGIVCLVVAFVVGGFIGKLLRAVGTGIGEAIPIKLDWAVTGLALRAIVILGGLILCFTGRIPFVQVLDSVLPVGNFDALAQAFWADQSPTFVSGVMSVAWNQLILVLISFLPFFLITQVINLIKTLFCSREVSSAYAFVAYIPEFLTMVAANVAVLYLGRALPWLLLQFISTIKLQYGLLRFLILGLLLFVYLYFVICDMFGSDVFIAMMGANIAAVILGVDLLGGMRTAVLLLTIVIGYVSKIARHFTIVALAGDEESDSAPTISVLYGIGAIVVLSLAFLGILKLMGC